MSEHYNPKLVKILIDILSVISLFGFFVVMPIVAHYTPNGLGPDGKPNAFVTTLVAGIFFALFGLIWLGWRYAKPLSAKYPFVRSAPFKILVIGSGPLLAIAVKILWG